MTLKELQCPDCGAFIRTDKENDIVCEYCGSEFTVDEDAVIFDYGAADEESRIDPPGPKRSEKAKAPKSKPAKVRKISESKAVGCLFVLGLLIFPVPVTVYFIFTDEFKKKTKIIVIAVSWAVYAAIVLLLILRHRAAA